MTEDECLFVFNQIYDILTTVKLFSNWKLFDGTVTNEEEIRIAVKAYYLLEVEGFKEKVGAIMEAFNIVMDKSANI